MTYCTTILVETFYFEQQTFSSNIKMLKTLSSWLIKLSLFVAYAAAYAETDPETDAVKGRVYYEKITL